ncbi:hypothetical protein H6P81_019000 [Aristolochia fimbriata]|uniref:Uncharacterized protein n=1 Tax=Aristolochia fimbriata TaxID=158543 RepID=A0AAV7E5Q6_ARIFI|nr:hypothetical protein H6P81_019000 [Aristolochia fimbriata]
MAASIRSTSMPTRPHPISEQVKECLNQLKQWEDQSLPSTSSSLCTGFSRLCGLYQSIDDLLQLPQSTQQDLADKGCVDEVLECSIRLLDAGETASDVLLQIKDSLEDVQMALRRRSGTDAELQKSMKTYISLKKMISIKQKTVIKSLKALKKDKCGFSSADDEPMAVVREAMSISINVIELLLSYFSASSKTASVKGCAVLKWIGSGRVACEEEAKKMNEVERVDAFLSALYSQKSNKLEEKAQDVQELLKSFIGSMQGIDDGLNLLQRRLIQTRVSLLNILSH